MYEHFKYASFHGKTRQHIKLLLSQTVNILQDNLVVNTNGMDFYLQKIKRTLYALVVWAVVANDWCINVELWTTDTKLCCPVCVACILLDGYGVHLRCSWF